MSIAAKVELTGGERIQAWIFSGFAFAMMLLFLATNWSGTTWGTKLEIVIAGIVCARFAWMIQEDAARGKICPCCGKRHQ
jgi:hypothetical protein